MAEFKANTMKKSAPGSKGGLNQEIQARIGHQLRAMYDDVVRQGVPDRFAELIKRLDEPQQGETAAVDSERRD
ncbi:NepR family anti-sigma factor [Rhodopseudomonas sp.]|uniref:NepR family anti-sigma factor n=1 Tax=Rhodopseudomonas sp. TaxID=1078 RepID=UPI003B3A8907